MNERKLFQKYNISINETSEFFQQNDMKKLNRVSSKKFKNLKNKKGITLIALVISIIVMLILAGVSLNATIGDNGIITQAQNATYMQSLAALEEYLNNYYVEHYEEFESVDNKAEALEKNSESSEWIWNPSKNGYGAIGYVINKDGNACYFIQKEKLPEEIKKQLKGGDAGKGTYLDYANMNDVYGVTGNLKVYYSNKGDIYGISKENLDLDNPAREVLPAGNRLSTLITGDANKNLTADNAKKISELTIDESSGVTDLSDLYVLTSLKKLILSNVELESLNGIQNAIQLNEIKFKNVKINNYSSLCNVINLEKLYFEYSPTYTTAQTEIEKIFSQENGIANIDFVKLTSLGIFGMDSIEEANKIIQTSTKSLIDDLSCINNLSMKTKNNIQYLYINNNNIDNIEYLEEFNNLKKIRCEMNRITSLKGLNSNNLSTLIASYNKLGENENETEKNDSDSLRCLENTNISVLNLSYNNIKWASYLKDCKKISEIYLYSNSQLIKEDLVLIKNIYNKCSALYKDINENYLSLFSTDKRINYTGKNLEDDSIEIAKLKNNTDVEQLCLDGNNKLTNEKLNEILSTCTNIKVLSLRYLNQLTNIDFIKNMKNINELDLRDTNVTDLTILDNITTMGTLYISNENIDLSTIQNLIENLDGRNISGSATFTSYPSSGLIISNFDLIKKLNNCTKIKKLKMVYQNVAMNKKSTIVDLSNCVELKNFEAKNVLVNFKLPNSIENASFVQSSANYPADLSLATNLKTLQVGHCIELTEEKSKEWFNQISKCSNLEKLELYETRFENLNGIEKLANCTNLTELDLSDYNYRFYMDNIKGIENLITLKVLKVGGRHIKDISYLSTLVNLEYLNLSKNNISDISCLENMRNLIELNLNGNNITALKPLENLKKLTSLDISNNLLYDTATYYEENEKKSYKNLEIISSLNYNKNGSLKTIYIAENTGIIDYSILEKLSWENKNGF